MHYALSVLTISDKTYQREGGTADKGEGALIVGVYASKVQLRENVENVENVGIPKLGGTLIVGAALLL